MHDRSGRQPSHEPSRAVRQCVFHEGLITVQSVIYPVDFWPAIKVFIPYHIASTERSLVMKHTTRLARVASIATVLAGMLICAATAAADTSGYHVANTQGLGVTVRSGPSQQTSAIGHIPEGAAITITCQTTGTDVNGSQIWDILNTGGYVSDYYTDTPGVGDFSMGVCCPPHCGKG
jgi:uncharacterized protein YraI